MQSYPVPDSRPSPSIPEAQPEADTFEPNISSQRVTQSSRKRTSADAGFVSAEAEDNLEDATFESQTSTRRSKRTKTSPKNNETGDKDERRVRKISKLKLKITQGRAPKKGALGPNGEVRTREDGRMEFRDADNPEWSKQNFTLSTFRIKLTEFKLWLHITMIIVGNSLTKLPGMVNLVRSPFGPHL